MKEAKDRKTTSQKAERCREQRGPLVHRLKHVIEEQRQSDIARISSEANHIAIENKLAANQELAQYCRQKIEQIYGTSGPGSAPPDDSATVPSFKPS